MEDYDKTLLDSEAIARAEALGMNARFVVEGYMAGEHRSPFHGFAIEFSQHREYTPGDDVRHLDWKVLGRTERYYIKQYEQETNFVAHLLVDGSESMSYGSGALTKFEFAKVTAACLSYLVIRQRDAVSLGIFDDDIREHVPRSDNRSTLFQIMSRLSAYRPEQGTNLARVLHGMAHKVQRRGIFIVISDFFDDEEALLEGVQHLRFGGHEVILIQVMDRQEVEFQFEGLVQFEGLEGVPALKTRPSEIRASYLGEVEAFRSRLRQGCERNDCHFVSVNTGDSMREVLAGYLAFRKRTATR